VLPRLVATGHLNDLELDFVRKDGSILTALVNSLAIFDSAGRFVMARSSVIDISARKALEEERERQRERLASLSGRLVSVQEDERRRLSGELHDRTSPNLAALDVSLRTLARCLPLNGDGKAATLLDDAMAMLADTNESLREVCADLRPPVLDFAGLLPALQSYGQQFRRRCGIDVDVQWQGESARLDPQVESTLFRIAQEAFANCAKHAGATRVNVSIRTTASAVTMAIEDDGKGFAANDADGSRSGAGPGIVSMRERTQFLGGSLQVESVPGAGTRVSAVIPVVGGRVRASAPDFRAIALRTDLA
jgi:signal transduction histidine kinase